MGELDLDAMVIDMVRRHTGNDAAGPRSRFDEDLHLSENGRKALFAFLVEAFSARGVNLPARGFFQSDFLKCQSPGDVQTAIRDALSGVRKKAAATPKPAAAATPPAAAPAVAAPPAPSPAAAPAPSAGASLAETAKRARKAPAKKATPPKARKAPRAAPKKATKRKKGS